MDSLRGRYRVPHRNYEVLVGTNSVVLDRSFVTESLRREAPRNDGLDVVRGAVNALIISLIFWIALGASIFAFL